MEAPISFLPLLLGHIPLSPMQPNLGNSFDYRDYHTFDAIYPVGFTSKRKFHSTPDGTKKIYYTCVIREGPLFQIIPQSESTIQFENSSLSLLWENFLSSFDDAVKLEPEWPLFTSGEDFFGLEHAVIKKQIEVRA